MTGGGEVGPLRGIVIIAKTHCAANCTNQGERYRAVSPYLMSVRMFLVCVSALCLSIGSEQV